MKTTIDIPDAELEEVMRRSGAQTKREAVVAAIVEFNRRRRLRELVDMFGKSPTFMTQDDLTCLREES